MIKLVNKEGMQFNTIFITLAALAASLMCAIANATDQCPVGYPDNFPFNRKKACLDAEDLLYDDVNSIYEIAPNSEADLIVINGVPPFQWIVIGKGFYLDAEHLTNHTTSDMHKIKIFTQDACGYCEVTVVDACGTQVTGKILSTMGQWKKIDDLVRLGVGQTTGKNPTYSTTVYADENTKYRTSQLYTRFRGFNAYPAEERVERGCAHGADKYRVNYGEPYVTPPEPWIKCTDTWVWHHPEWTDLGSVRFLVSGSYFVVNGWEEGAITEKWTCGK